MIAGTVLGVKKQRNIFVSAQALMSSLERSSEWQVAGLLFSELDAGRMLEQQISLQTVHLAL
jgi:hypothetical protein